MVFAHIEEVQHLHPHPAGMPWESVVLIALVMLFVAAAVVVVIRRTAESGRLMVALGLGAVAVNKVAGAVDDE